MEINNFIQHCPLMKQKMDNESVIKHCQEPL
jgi:hypothetical protein